MTAAAETTGSTETRERSEDVAAVTPGEDGAGPDAAVEPDLTLEPTPDRLTLLLTCEVPAGDREALLDRLEEELAALDAAEPPDRAALAESLAALAPDGGPLVGAVLLRGEPAEPTEHGRLEWAEDFFAEGFATDEYTEAVDYWQRREHLDVQAEQLLARVHPPRAGKPGRDVLGAEIPVEEPVAVELRAGPGVRTEEEPEGSTAFSAGTSGRLRWADGLLAVDEVYTIRGDVSLETGNIRHPGALIVGGDVKAGATVEAEGDVLVQGMVEPATIRAGGSLTVRGGVVGGEGHVLELGGGLQARYLTEADVTAADDVVVVNEISRSQVRTRGAVLLPKGRITASEVTALRGIVAEQAGGQGLSATVLIAGIDHRLPGQVRARQEKITLLERKLEKIDGTVAAALERQVRLDERQRTALAGLQQEQARYRQALSTLRGAVAALRRAARQRAVESIEVKRRTFPDTELRIGEARTRIPRLIEEPRRFARSGREIVVVDDA